MAPVSVQGTSAKSKGYVARRDATGTKLDVPILSTPQTITVVTRDQMDAQHVQTVPQAIRYVPGVVTETWGADARFDSKYNSMIVRGFAPEEYLDGMKVLAGIFTTPQPDPYGLESVTMVQGPASVLYGQTAPGGVFNLTSKQPTVTPLHEVELETGSYHRVQLAADVGGPIDDAGHFRYRLTAMGRDADTQVEFQKSERLFVAPAFAWQPDDKTSLTLLTSYQWDPHAGFYYYYPVQGTLFANPDGPLSPNFYGGDGKSDRYTLRQVSAGWLFTHRFNDAWSFEQHARYGVSTNAINMVYPIGFSQTSEGDTDYGAFDRDVFVNQERLGAVTVDNQAHTTFTTGALVHTALFGVDYQDGIMRRAFGDIPGPSLDLADPNYAQSVPSVPLDYRSRQTQWQVGGYAQDLIGLGHWVALVGIREDKAQTNTRDLVAQSSVDQLDHAASGRAGLVYKFDNGFAPYVSYSTSFQPTGGTDYFNKPFKPTTGQQYEAGLKYQPQAFDALFSVSVYNLMQQNVTTQDLAHSCSATPAPPQCGDFSVQTGEVRSRGAELSTVMSVIHGLDLTTSYAYVDNAVTKANDDSKGKHVVGVPSNTANLWASYRVPSGPFAHAGLSAGVRYVGKSYIDNENTMTVPAFTLVDAGVQYDLGALLRQPGWRLSLSATNLLDKTYLSACDIYGCYFGNRRNVLAGLSRRW